LAIINNSISHSYIGSVLYQLYSQNLLG